MSAQEYALKEALCASTSGWHGASQAAIAAEGRTIFYEWMKDDKSFAKEVNDIQNIALDFAESQLHKQIGDGSTIATIFYLKTKGKNRGYIERQEIEHNQKDNEFNIRIIK